MSPDRPLGIITLEENILCPPGTPRNPSTFRYPVCYEVIPGAVDLDSSNEEDLVKLIDAGQALIAQGAYAIAGNCGRMIIYQDQLAAALPVPVFLSGLLQLPLIARMYSPAATIGILASSTTSLTSEHLHAAMGPMKIKIAIGGMEGRGYFDAAVNAQSGTLDFDRVQEEVVAVAQDLQRENPELKAILLECVDLPPYAKAVQEAVGLPVFDITTMIEHAHSALVRSPFNGPR